MRQTAPLLLSTQGWKFQTVEWNSKVAAIQPQLLPPNKKNYNSSVTHFVLPDHPKICTPEDRANFLRQTIPAQRIITLATCRYATPQELLQSIVDVQEFDKLLLVGGNEKTPASLSVVDAAHIILDKNNDMSIWGVTNPNDPQSLERVQEKIEAGLTGFVTQPLLSSPALDILESYPRWNNNNNTIHYVAGMALPTSAKNLHFWCDLLDNNEELRQDALFKAHVAFFAAQPHFCSFEWIAREVMNLATRASIHGMHFMPMKNTKDLLTILRRLK